LAFRGASAHIPDVTGEILFIFNLIGVAAVLMASNRVRSDVIALLVVLALMLRPQPEAAEVGLRRCSMTELWADFCTGEQIAAMEFNPVRRWLD
jgi:hypothetical protein